eukprot:CAMPEP_0168440992 /NCGR_PEP_ID=MMETSP0228-20121227/43258_1 /TAXON_ID=133427 /ORGANISM="Protoceratium reticulatum, Strain CCCM 535 (=CCMP 1889)" /LENGTH=40 /DNA_ID= /DNA_START= /DNA_END= /DNA_ORIENTATION=
MMPTPSSSTLFPIACPSLGYFAWTSALRPPTSAAGAAVPA